MRLTYDRRHVAPLPATSTTSEQRSYVAGFLDGEGCLSVAWIRGSAVGLYITVNVTNTYLPILEDLKEVWGGNVVTIRNTEPGRWKQKYRWEVGGKYADRLLREVCPFLKVKAAQAALLLSFRDGAAEASAVFAQVRQLNKRGPIEAAS